MKDTDSNPKEILNIETPYVEGNSHTFYTSALLTVAYLHNLHDNKPHYINICGETIFGEYKTQRNNPHPDIYLQTADGNVKDMLTRKPGRSDLYVSISSRKNDTSVGGQYHLPAGIIKRHINLYAAIIHTILQQCAISPECKKGTHALLFPKRQKRNKQLQTNNAP